MKTDLFTKIVLTVIAVCLVIIVGQQLQIFTPEKAYASPPGLPSLDKYDVRIYDGKGTWSNDPLYVKIVN